MMSCVAYYTPQTLVRRIRIQATSHPEVWTDRCRTQSALYIWECLLHIHHSLKSDVISSQTNN